jgi:hypothetical protein
MKIAVFYDDGRVVVQYDERTFAELLEEYCSKGLTPTQALREIVKQIKKETQRA